MILVPEMKLSINNIEEFPEPCELTPKCLQIEIIISSL